MNQVKAWRPPGLEHPFEYGLVKTAGPIYIIDMDGERGEIVWHKLDTTTGGYFSPAG
jgi:hypothetical protein